LSVESLWAQKTTDRPSGENAGLSTAPTLSVPRDGPRLEFRHRPIAPKRESAEATSSTNPSASTSCEGSARQMFVESTVPLVGSSLRLSRRLAGRPRSFSRSPPLERAL
jgi:hypothetical protein